jgi:hypothetical protein
MLCVEGGVRIVVISFIRTCIDDIFTIQLSSLFIVYELFFQINLETNIHFGVAPLQRANLLIPVQ